MYAPVEARLRQAQQADTKETLFWELKSIWPNSMRHGLYHGSLTIHHLQRLHLQANLPKHWFTKQMAGAGR